jgi:hypothetical protein
MASSARCLRVTPATSKNSTWKASWRSQNVLCRPPRTSVQASLEQRQRFQQLFFPEGIVFDRNRFVRTGVTAPGFSYLQENRTENEGLVDLTGVEPFCWCFANC